MVAAVFSHLSNQISPVLTPPIVLDEFRLSKAAAVSFYLVQCIPMSDALPPDIKQIINAQTKQRKQPTTVTLPVLPQIASTSKSNERNKSAVVESVSLPKITTDAGSSSRLALELDRVNIAEQNVAATIKGSVSDSDFRSIYSYIPDHEALLRESTAHAKARPRVGHSTSTRDVDRSSVIKKQAFEASEDSISLLNFRLAHIPSALPEIADLQTAIDNLSPRRIQSILDACRLYDKELRKHLSVPSMIKCIGEVVPSVHSPSSPWRAFLQSMAPEGEFIEYEKLLDLIIKSRRPDYNEETMPGLLDHRDIEDSEYAFKSSTSQASRQRIRAQVMTEIEVLLVRNPELSLDRLTTATTQKTIEISEFKMILELYGLEEAFRPFYQRLVNCFLTHDNKIHFSAFAACLALVRPPIRKSAPVAPIPPWSKPSLAPISAKHVEPSMTSEK